MIKDGFDQLMSIWEADEQTDGWTLLKEENGVVVHKKAAVGMYTFLCHLYVNFWNQARVALVPYALYLLY